MTKTTATSSTDELQVWIGDLSAYNAGRLVGEWVSITDADALTEAYRNASHNGTSDYFIADTAGPAWFAQVVGEYTTEEALTALADALADVHDFDAFGAWFANEYRRDIADADSWADEFREQFRGEFDSIGDYAYELWFECADAAERAQADRWPFSCIDWDHAGRELIVGGGYWTSHTGAGTVYVFSAD
jgi:hypothetical protein